jgi:hypothetical protein
VCELLQASAENAHAGTQWEYDPLTMEPPLEHAATAAAAAKRQRAELLLHPRESLEHGAALFAAVEGGGLGAGMVGTGKPLEASRPHDPHLTAAEYVRTTEHAARLQAAASATAAPSCGLFAPFMRLPRQQQCSVDRLAAPKEALAPRLLATRGDPLEPSLNPQTWQHWAYSGAAEAEAEAEAGEAPQSPPPPPPTHPVTVRARPHPEG